MPVGVMIALVGYTLREVGWLDPWDAIPVIGGLVVTAVLQLWRSHLVLSLTAGTVLYVITATAVSLSGHPV